MTSETEGTTMVPEYAVGEHKLSVTITRKTTGDSIVSQWSSQRWYTNEEDCVASLQKLLVALAGESSIVISAAGEIDSSILVSSDGEIFDLARQIAHRATDDDGRATRESDGELSSETWTSRDGDGAH